MEKRPPATRTPDRKLVYKHADGLDLPMHLYYPSQVKESYPLILCIHGGGWAAREDNSTWDGGWMASHAEWFSVRGAIGCAISYRSYIPEKTSLRMLIEDCASALQYILEHSRELQADPEQIAVMGDSAGGHLASCLGTICALDNGIGARLKAVIALNPITDLSDEKWSGRAGGEAEKLSPLLAVSAYTPRFLLMHGLNDSIVDARHSIGLSKQMEGMGRPHELFLLNGVEHAFILRGYESTDEQVEQYMAQCERFLQSAGVLP